MYTCIFIRKSLILSLLFITISATAIAQAPRTVPATYASTIIRSYTCTWDATAPEQTPNTLMTRPLKDVKQSTLYVDGLGRPLQTVIEQGSLITNGTPVDMISAAEYDAFGREQFKYLPSPSTATDATKNDGNLKLNAFAQQASFYANASAAINPIAGQGETFFYGQTVFESSPLNRVTETSAAGNSWTGSMWNTTESNRRSVKTKYYLNTLTDGIRIWNVTNGVSGNFGTYASPAAYGAGLLNKIISVDEQGKQIIEFKDKEGKVILKKIQFTAASDNGTGSSHAGWLCTYYIYDDLNNLRCVIQPKGVELIPTWSLTDPVILAEQCFRYEYDERNRMIKKKVPGAGEVWMVYDPQDRVVMTQDANLRAQGKWLYTQYDDLHRILATGITYDSHDQAYNANLAKTTSPYPNLAVMGYELNTHILYDDYSWLPNYPVPASFTSNRITTYDSYLLPASSSWPYVQQVLQSNAIRGMATGSRVFMPGLGYNGNIFYTVNFYDAKGRLIQTQSNNITGGIDITITQYNWSGQPLLVIQKNEKAGTPAQTTLTVTQMTYDDLGRITKTEKKLSNTLVNSNVMSAYTTISAMQYDALGQLDKKSFGTNPANPTLPLETVNYDYNIRGWMLGGNRDFIKDVTTNYFGFDLGYDKNGSLGTYVPQYNGNISGTVWKTAGDNQKRKYDFTYDPVNRLTAADFNQYVSGSGTSAVFDNSAGVDFTATNMGYDANGNMITLNHYGLKLNTSPLIDQLSYTYQASTNKLSKVTDAANDNTSTLGDFKYDPATKGATDYAYDVNGNLSADNNKKISSIAYNFLNLPSVITVTGKGTITYTYDATGKKLQKQTIDNSTTGKTVTTTTTYINGFVYETKSTVPIDANDPDYVDALQFIGHEEGRIRKKTTGTFAYDYFLKDHLGNVRMVLTGDQQTDIYPVATLETSNLATEQAYYNITSGQIVDKGLVTGLPAYVNHNIIPTNPVNPTFDNANSAKVYKLNKNSQNVGLGITLRVMSGDKLDIYGKSYYFQNNTGGSTANTAVTTLNVLTGFLGGPTGGVTSVHGSVNPAQLNGISNTISEITNLFTNQTNNNNLNTQIPKAFINYILFDEQFKSVGSGFAPVGANSVLTDYGTTPALHNIPVIKNGFVYIYCSNESPVDVFFDNLQVMHTRGPILEETHYYPFGLTMAGISSQAAGSLENLRKFNKGSELQHKEFSDGSGLELYATNFRSLDPQLGRWWQIDPKPDYAQSLYSSMNNNPILINDPFGDTARIQFRTGFLGLGGKKQADYNNGKLTNKDGSAYTGKVNGFLKKAVAGLDKLSAGGATGKGLVNDIVNSTQTVNIIKGENSFNATDKATGMTNVVRWNPGNGSGGPDAALNQSRPSFIGLGHELAHAQDQVFDGKVDYSPWYTPAGTTTPVANAEIYSTHVENRLRAENNIGLRAFYGINNSTGTPQGEGPVLISGTRQNANTITANGLNLVNPTY